MSVRNFGLSSPRHVGAKTIPGAPASRVAVSREPIQLAGKTSRPANSRGESSESFIREGATAFFVAAFASFPVVTVWFLCAVIDWEGVWETIVRMFDLG